MRINTIIFVSKVSLYSTDKVIQLKLKYKNKVKKIPLHKGIYSLDMEITYEVMLAIFIDKAMGDFIHHLENLNSLEEIKLCLFAE
ncbi:hypothetical protein A6A19_07660 [Actinobacillus delphinicola]|uniref:hypothetical protein n=1 Tax=Actinobacillus delphinicola TaxID=51161 RepID=UPI0024435517|nr:hypothetical protein [Actinobacillus delphinicola]MDG6897850.1 hypothetical protein [Actinobacillus delphinicola]